MGDLKKLVESVNKESYIKEIEYLEMILEDKERLDEILPQLAAGAMKYLPALAKGLGGFVASNPLVSWDIDKSVMPSKEEKPEEQPEEQPQQQY